MLTNEWTQLCSDVSEVLYGLADLNAAIAANSEHADPELDYHNSVIMCVKHIAVHVAAGDGRIGEAEADTLREILWQESDETTLTF